MKIRLLLTLLATVLFLLPSETYARSDAGKVMDSVVRISGSNSDKEPVMGSGFLVKAALPRQAWLISAAHFFKRLEEKKIELLLRRSSGQKVTGFSQAYNFTPEQGLVVDKQHDLAAFLIELPQDCSCRLLSEEMFASESDFEKLEVGNKLLIYGFPYGESFEQTGNAVVRGGIVSSFPLMPVNIYSTFLADFEVFAGYSGGPVFFEKDGRFRLAGMILEEVFLEELRPEKKTVRRTRRGLGLARVLNSLIIKEFIARRLQR